ncbi:Colicin I receptor precursor [Lacunisphaera limnophila]|uniref:Colicin I receptor n=1 Tax=Lacunisphaera limnophila TaxID=1838286 RepID=A0A1D8AUF0_9BACT|nr:TonB-dependent receptor [Lacunisphaera limnophila]AOS44519.1 Colicin I receptor precursor [Lacunisphaera limnophila]
MPSAPLRPVLLLLALAGGLPLAAQTIVLPTVVISAARTAEAPDQVPFSVALLSGDQLRASPAATPDGALRAVPGFSLFRRSDSLSANPTAQGVSLRGLGPSGASRSLVLLDGVPLNDPFGGWVAWSKVPREALAGAEVVRGGGATAWGNAALGGIVQLLTETAPTRDSSRGIPAGRLAVAGGSFATHRAEVVVNQPVGAGTFQFSARDFATDGFHLVTPEDRGAIDRPAASEHRWFAGRWRQEISPGTQLSVTARTYDEDRNNGTPYQQNSSREDFASVSLARQPGADFAWEALAYAQDQSFASTFSSVNPTRTAETPASNQFAVPATAYGAAWTGVWKSTPDARTSAGLDWRRVRGETREHYTYSAGAFTRERVAGGTQEIAGLFALHERALAPGLRATLGGRLDAWRELAGHRRETERATGNVLRHDTYADRDGVEFSPSAGLVWAAAPGWRVRAAAQHAFRRPTLNELYRPFRVGNVITEANAALATERATSAELGVDYASPTLALGAAVFWNDLRDAVGNVTLHRGPGSFPIVGFVPAGGLGRQRLNLDRTRVQGLELWARWTPAAALSLTADYLYNDATVRVARAAPALAGRRLAQVPQHVAAFGASWSPARAVTLTPRVRFLGRQFEDDENLLRLGAALIVDLGASYQLTEKVELFLNAENLTDERIETGRSADGLVNTGTPRLVLGGVRCAW